MKFEEIHDLVKGVPYISPDNAHYLYDLIIQEHFVNILELGIAHGTATCYMAAALDELNQGKIVSVDLIEAKELFHPTAEEQLQKAHLEHFVKIVRMQTGYTWFLHNEIKRLTKNNQCKPEYDLCIIDGPKNWTIDGYAFFLVDKILNENGLIIFDDYLWTYAEADKLREATDGIVHRKLSDSERNTPHIKEVYELLVMQHPQYCEFSIPAGEDWAIARKGPSKHKKITTTSKNNIRRFISRWL